MEVLNESGIVIDDANYYKYFKLSNSKFYKSLSGYGNKIKIECLQSDESKKIIEIPLGFKEMDIILYNSEKNKILFIELSDFSNTENEQNYIEKQKIEFFKKALDAYNFLLSLKFNTKYFEASKEFEFDINLETKIRFCFIVNNLNLKYQQYIPAFNKSIKGLMKPYFMIFDNDNLQIEIFDYQKAKQLDFVN